MRSELLTSEVLPPTLKRKRGRPRKKRTEQGRQGVQAGTVESEQGDPEEQDGPEEQGSPEEAHLAIVEDILDATNEADGTGRLPVAVRSRSRRPSRSPWVWIEEWPQSEQEVVSRTRSGKS